MRLLLIAFDLTLSADIALACSCGPPPPVLDAYERAPAVVVGRVLSVKADKENSKFAARYGGWGEATFVVEKVYKGNLRVNSRIVVGGAPNGACGWSFHEKTAGQQFLLYLIAVDEKGARWDASTCGRTRTAIFFSEVQTQALIRKSSSPLTALRKTANANCKHLARL